MSPHGSLLLCPNPAPALAAYLHAAPSSHVVQSQRHVCSPAKSIQPPTKIAPAAFPGVICALAALAALRPSWGHPSFLLHLPSSAGQDAARASPLRLGRVFLLCAEGQGTAAGQRQRQGRPLSLTGAQSSQARRWRTRRLLATFNLREREAETRVAGVTSLLSSPSPSRPWPGCGAPRPAAPWLSPPWTAGRRSLPQTCRSP